jgi:hypothetical protein
MSVERSAAGLGSKPGRRVRVYELARATGQTSREVLDQLSEMGEFIRSASAVVPPDAATRLLSQTQTPQPSGEALELILAAFEAARDSDRPDWHTMTTAVLKNRLLDLTQRQFREGQFGVANITELVSLFPEHLELNVDGPQAKVTLIDPHVLLGPHSPHREGFPSRQGRSRVRPDLWRAVIDYRSGSYYVWDTSIQMARRGAADEPHPPMPTVSAHDVQTWRSQFVSQVENSLDPSLASRLHVWVENEYGTAYLPVPLRGQWNGFTRGKVVERLKLFFSAVGEDLPPDTLTEATTASDSESVMATGTEELRRLLRNCVAVMTEQELLELRLSPAIFLRAQRKPRE